MGREREKGRKERGAELAPTCFRHNRHRRCCLHIYWDTVSCGALFPDSFFFVSSPRENERVSEIPVLCPPSPIILHHDVFLLSLAVS